MNEHIIPLRERRLDLFFIVVFAAFAFTSFFADRVNALAAPAADSGWFWARAVYDLYAVGNDPLLIANPVWLRTMCALSAFVFGPFYLVLVYAFIRGRNWVRPFAFIYAGMIVESLIVILAVEFAGESALFTQVCTSVKPAAELAAQGLNADLSVQNIPKFLAYNLPYKIVPILLVIRMWHERPFSPRG